jgi:hypothetical protein
MRYLIFFILIVSSIYAKDFTPKLSKGEYKFKDTLAYRLKDFNFNWSISYVRVVSYVKFFGEKKELRYKDLHTVFSSDKRVLSKKDKRDILYLAKLMNSRESYDIKGRYGAWGYRRYVVIFINNDGKMFALESKRELKDMLGGINTSAELLMWLRLNYSEYPYSFRYKKGVWRVRYSGWDLGRCYYGEYFKYYNSKGAFIRKKEIRHYRKKGCIEIME